MPENNSRVLIASCLADFLMYLTAMPDPIIIGGAYPRNKLLEAFNKWLKDRNFCVDGADIFIWREACNKGLMKGSNGHSS